ncbi:hypothetical protein ACLGI4_13440 [Streptomyces sp. HMX112]|uniref:hypothetical protein n=1 Tax=Streptomyces sp. HMX112 TaxID=3390850 RepID=UPI003A7F68CC
MSYRPRAEGRSGSGSPHATVLLATLAVLFSLLVPVGTGTASAAEAGDCAALPLASLGGTAEGAMGRVTVPAQGSVCFTVDVERPGAHRVLTGNDLLFAQVYDGDRRLECDNQTAAYSSGWCDLPRTGTYTVRLPNHWEEEQAGTLVVLPLGAATAGCAGDEVHTSFSSPGATGTAPDPFTVLCHRLVAAPGERIDLDPHAGDMAVESWITDGSGAPICPNPNGDGSRGCVLPGEGPYRVLVRVVRPTHAFPAGYTLTARRLSDPAGCATVPVNAYGSAPTTVEPAVGCKVFRASTAGRYDVHTVGPGGYRDDTLVHDRAGRTVCEGAPCVLPADGDYTILTDGSTLIIDRRSAAGCEPAALGLHSGTWSSPAAVDCLTLPLPEGARMAALTAFSGFAATPDITVVDADGDSVCTESRLAQGSCTLTGPAPYRALVSQSSGGSGDTAYRVAFHRTDPAGSGCQVLPAGDFTAATASAVLRTGAGGFSYCLAIPADAHSAVESVQMRTVSGTAGGAFWVLDASGTRVCSMTTSAPAAWTTCRLTPGAAYTALFNGRDGSGEHSLVRRDVTATAEGCAPTAATTADGPSTPGVPGPPGTLVCHRVTTAGPADTLHLNVRDPLGTANIVAFGADDAVRTCTWRNRSCAVTGSSQYQVLLGVPSSLKAAGSYRLDALRVATAAGPAPECVKVPDVTFGYGPVTGTLDEEHTAICAELPTSYRDSFTARVSDTNGAAHTAVPALYGKDLDNTCTGMSNGESSCALTGPYTTGTVPSLFVLGLPEKASGTSYRAELVCAVTTCGTGKREVTGVTPATGVTGTQVRVTVSGSGLHEGDKVRIGAGGTTIESTTVSVAADRRTLTASLDLTTAPTGTWPLSVITSHGWEHSTGHFTVTAPRPPVNTTVPGIAGTVRVGAELTARPGTWAPAPTSYTYQWKADGAAIPGATAATYVPPAPLLNKKLSVAVTAHLTGAPSGTASSAATAVAPGAAPAATTPPALAAAPQVGARVYAKAGVWTPAATSYTYQWRAEGLAITGATASSYVPTAAQLGRRLSVTVKAARTGHAGGAAASTAVTVARGAAPRATTRPSVSGTAKAGRTLTANRGVWTPAPTSYGYQWYANGRAIAGATKSTFVLTRAQRGLRITVKATAHRTGHHSGTAYSVPTAAVVA